MSCGTHKIVKGDVLETRKSGWGLKLNFNFTCQKLKELNLLSFHPPLTYTQKYLAKQKTQERESEGERDDLVWKRLWNEDEEG